MQCSELAYVLGIRVATNYFRWLPQLYLCSQVQNLILTFSACLNLLYMNLMTVL